MKDIPDKSIDAIITDPPYGTLKDINWDKIIDLDKMWSELKRIIKIDGVIVLTCEQPFTSILITSNIEMFRYTWVWNKVSKTGFLNSMYKPLKQTEDIAIFSLSKVGSKANNPIKYNPQGVVLVNKNKNNNPNETWRDSKGNSGGGNQLNNGKNYTQKYTNHPSNLLTISTESIKNFHPTQKPVALMEYLIKTYTNENETVLDFTMGSGSTMVACQRTNRNGIGIEINEEYFNIAKKRIKNTEVDMIVKDKQKLF